MAHGHGSVQEVCCRARLRRLLCRRYSAMARPADRSFRISYPPSSGQAHASRAKAIFRLGQTLKLHNIMGCWSPRSTAHSGCTTATAGLVKSRRSDPIALQPVAHAKYCI